MGSWKIIAILPPRISLRSASFISSTFCPSKKISPLRIFPGGLFFIRLLNAFNVGNDIERTDQVDIDDRCVLDQPDDRRVDPGTQMNIQV